MGARDGQPDVGPVELVDAQADHEKRDWPVMAVGQALAANLHPAALT